MKHLKSLLIIIPILVFSWGIYIKLNSEPIVSKDYCVNRILH